MLMDELFKKLDINPQNLKFYETAFQHSSYVNENHMKSDYERLEFLGDAVLELVMSDYLYKNVNLKEGDLTKLRASYVCENALYEYSMDLELSKFIKVGHGEEIDGGRFKKVIMADIFEALMGAIYLDLGFDIVKRVLLNIIVPYVENPKIVFFSDYKSALQEFVQTEQRSLSYEVIDEQGPSHNKSFTVNVKIDDIVYGVGTAGSKKEAEQEAAHDALGKLAVK
ncbi:MAG: ribonuclease III [Bacilli bacterium]|nr:ribonuclease III [Bacilli bacterium]